jgi:2-methylcitrate dehydratase
MPEQYRAERIQRQDVQTLLRKVSVRPLKKYSCKFPNEIPSHIIVTLRDGGRLVNEKRDYEGFRTRPMRWETVVEKFERLSTAYAHPSLRRRIVDAVANLEKIRVRELTGLLADVKAPATEKMERPNGA